MKQIFVKKQPINTVIIMILFRNFITADFVKLALYYFNDPAWEDEKEKA